MFFSFATAHQGFNRLAWEEQDGEYVVSILEDFHVFEEAKAQLVVQLADNDGQAMPDVLISASLYQEDKPIYQGVIPFAGVSNQAGRGFYANYILSHPISQAGLYKLELDLGFSQRTYTIEAQDGNRVSILEYLPNFLLLLIAVGGVSLLFIPLKSSRKDRYNYEAL